MQIVVERTSAPRPLQRPSDVERRPIDFGIEPTPPAPARPESTIIKPAISRDPDPIPDTTEIDSEIETSVENDDHSKDEEDWGEGIL